MTRQQGTIVAMLLVALTAIPTTLAQWPSDATENLLLADRPSFQIVPKISSTPDGGSYVGWYDMASGNFDVYLQRLDADGVEQWPHNGILISGHPQNSWVMDWQLITDSKGGAVLVFADVRQGNYPTIHAYRVSRNGKMLWGADGITLSQSSTFNTGARVVEASDGDFVFVWSASSPMGSGNIMMQRVSPQGVERLVGGGLLAVNGQGAMPGWPEIAPAEDGSVIVSWVTDTNYITTTNFLRAEKFLPSGESAWDGPVTVFDECSLPAAYRPHIAPDGSGGAFLVWHFVPFFLYNSAVQHLDADGNELWSRNGVVVSTSEIYNHLDPTMSYDSAMGDLYVFWSERTPPQTSWGVYGQKFSVDGQRMWGDMGVELLPVDGVNKSLLQSLPCEGGAMLFLFDQPKGEMGGDRILGMRVDSDGELLWGDGTVEVASRLSNKNHPALTIDKFGAVKLVWDDDRDGDWSTVDVYGQKIKPDGTLGN